MSGGRFMFTVASRSESGTGLELDHVPAHNIFAARVHASNFGNSLNNRRLHACIGRQLVVRHCISQLIRLLPWPRPINLPKRRAYWTSLFSLARVDPSDWLSFAATADQRRPQTLSNINNKPAIAIIRSADFGCGT